jgi:hypothetical protein
MAMDKGGLTFHKEEAKTHNSCSMISKAPQILKLLLFCKSVSMIDRVVMYTPVEPSNLLCCLLPELQKDQERLETGV